MFVPLRVSSRRETSWLEIPSRHEHLHQSPEILIVSSDSSSRGARPAEIREALERAGTPIGPNDLMIVAIAVSQGVTLITHNTREFSRVQQLMVEGWEKIP